MCINGNQQIALGQPDKMLGGNLRWTSIPSRESRNTPSRFILQKPVISAGLMGLLARPISIGGRLFINSKCDYRYGGIEEMIYNILPILSLFSKGVILR